MRPALLTATLLALAGCTTGPLVRDAPDRAAPPGYPDHSAADVTALLQEAAAPLAFESGARIEVRRDGRTDRATLTMEARADSISGTVRGPLGILVGRALATSDSAFLYDALKGRVLLGPVTAASAFVPGFDHPSGALLRGAVLGEAPPIPTDAAFAPAPGAGLSEGPAYRFSYRHQDGSESLWTVDAGLWRPLEYELRFDGTVVLRQRFSAFDTVDDRVVPRRVVFERPQDAFAVEIEHRDLRLDGTPTPSFRAPADAPRSRFD